MIWISHHPIDSLIHWFEYWKKNHFNYSVLSIKHWFWLLFFPSKKLQNPWLFCFVYFIFHTEFAYNSLKFQIFFFFFELTKHFSCHIYLSGSLVFFQKKKTLIMIIGFARKLFSTNHLYLHTHTNTQTNTHQIYNIGLT